jgi:hypothetical protein
MSIDFKARTAMPWVIAAVAFASVVAYCAPPGTFRRIDFEFTGTVLDRETHEPVEGAYVVAIYSGAAASPAAVAIYCTKTKGMYTGKDGKFHFPVEKLDNRSPGDVMAIKPGYFGNERKIPTGRIQRSQSAETYTGRDVYLTKQNPDKPEFRFGEVEVRCERATNKDDVEASILFMRTEVSELLRLKANGKGIDGIERFIGDLERLPSNGLASK